MAITLLNKKYCNSFTIDLYCSCLGNDYFIICSF